MGISSWVLTPVGKPVLLSSIAANLGIVAAGTATAATLNLFTTGLAYSCYMWVGGIACTLPLAVMLVTSKSKKLNALGKASIVPSVFNINEPVVFGCIAWNPYLMLPMWLQGIILPLITWFACKVIRFAPIPTVQFELWYCPYPINTFLNTFNQGIGTVARAFIFLAISIAVSSLIWYPFFKAYEKSCIQEEEESLGKKAKIAE